MRYCKRETEFLGETRFLIPLILIVGFLFAGKPAELFAQVSRTQPKIEIAWNRYYDYDEVLHIMERLQAAYPQFIRFEDIGHSYQGRVLRVMMLTNQETGSDRDKIAMWIDGNIHGNEIGGTETLLYLAWWLLEHYDSNQRARELLDRRVFYLLPSQNPDGRHQWFHEPDGLFSRSGQKPYDNDRDGLLDEDGLDDLDGDGEILLMRKKVPIGTGTHRLDPDEPRLMIPVSGDKKGDYIMLGREGIDNDGDGRVNEDGPGGYDMNRNWPSDWQPGYIQYGAGDYPLSYPETRAIGMFMFEHPNIAAVQSFHHTGGMILRGPANKSIEYPNADIHVYDEIGKKGESIIPFYRYIVIWKDLYTVHGGFSTWTYEGLGIFSFANELWSRAQYYGGKNKADQRGQLDFNDLALLGDVFVDWHPVQHPLYGEIEVGGFKREHGGMPPSFMIEEMLHRNAMFCVKHAEEIAELEAEPLVVEKLDDELWRVKASFRNKKLMPTRSAMAAQKKIGLPDRVSVYGEDIEVLAGGREIDRWRPELVEPVDTNPEQLLLESGVPSRGRVTLVWLVRGHGEINIEYKAEKSEDVTVTGRLE